MQEQNKVTLSWWVVVTDKGEHKITNKEMEVLMEADKRGARFVMFDEVVLNIAFIKEIYKRVAVKDLDYYSIAGEERFIVENRKQLNDNNIN